MSASRDESELDLRDRERILEHKWVGQRKSQRKCIELQVDEYIQKDIPKKKRKRKNGNNE